MIETILNKIEQTEKGLIDIVQGETLLWNNGETNLYRYCGKMLKFYYFRNEDTDSESCFTKDFYKEYLKYAIQGVKEK